MPGLLAYFMGQGEKPTMADLLREPGGAGWLNQLYGLAQMADRPTAWNAPDQVLNFQPQAHEVIDPSRLAGWFDPSPGVRSLQPSPSDNRDVVLPSSRPEFVNTMPKSWFSSDPSMAGALRDREIRDQRILSGSLFTDPNLSALLRSGAGYN